MAPRETQSSPYVPPGGLQDVSEVDITGRSCFRRPTTARCLRSQHQGRIPDPFDRPSASRDALNLGGLRENEYTRAVVDILQQSYLGPNPGSEVHTSCKIFLGNCRKIVEERFLAELYRVVLEAAARNESGSSQHRFLANVIDQGRPSEVIAEVKQLWRPNEEIAANALNPPLQECERLTTFVAELTVRQFDSYGKELLHRVLKNYEGLRCSATTTIHLRVACLELAHLAQKNH